MILTKKVIMKMMMMMMMTMTSTIITRTLKGALVNFTTDSCC